MAGTDVLVRFIGDASKLQSSVSQVEGTGGKIKSWAKGIGAAMGAAFAVDQIKDWIGAASALQDAIGATDVIFGKAAGGIEQWAGTTAAAFGIARSDALVAAGDFGTFGKSAGLTGKDLASFSTDLVGLSGDLASFKGTSTEEAITAVGAALRGESEPIRKYGVLLDVATLKNRAMAMGLISTTKDALSPQAKVLAAQAEILHQTGDAQGDFARTSDSAANQQKALQAGLKDTQAALGTALLPVLQQVLPILQKMAQFVQENAGWLVPLAAGLGIATAAVWAFNAAMTANPIGLIIAGIAALIAIIILVVKNWDTIAAAAEAAWNAVLDIVLSVWHSIEDAAGAVWDAVLQAIRTVWDWISSNWPHLVAILAGPFGIALDLIISNWDTIKSFFGNVVSAIGGIISRVGEILVAPFRWAGDQIHSIADGIGSAFTGAVNAVKGLWNGFARGWNGIHISIPSLDTHLPGIGTIGGGSFDLPNLPTLAKGGIVTGPTLALIGERGREAVLPLPRGGIGGGGSQTFNISVNVAPGTSPAEVGAKVVDAIRSYERVAGAAWRAA